MQSYAEREQDDSHLGELAGELDIGYESGGAGADGDSGEQVTQDRGYAEPLRDEVEEERREEPSRQGEDEVVRMHSDAW